MRVNLRKIKWNRIIIGLILVIGFMMIHHAWVQFQIDLTCLCE